MVYYPPEKKFDLDRIINQKDDELSDVGPAGKKKGPISFKKITVAFAAILLVVFVSGGYLMYKTNSTFDRVTGNQNSIFKSIIKMLPMGNSFFQVLPVEGENLSVMDKVKDDKLERLNVLLLGLRGVNDPNGGLLTDTMMVASINLKSGGVALISIPRDLYVEMPNHDYKRKINEAYVLGIEDRKDWKAGLEYAKKAVSNVTGLDIHYAVSVDFNAFKEIIDILGGVTITLDRPFSELGQFEEGPIYLPAGKQTIDGDTALLFSRARFSSSDFDRAKRQQQVLLAAKEKAMGLGVLSNPLKIISILDSIGNHIKTDAELWEIQEMAVLAKRIDSSKVKQKVFDTTENGLLYSSRDGNGSYILLPEGGNFDRIKQESQSILD